VGFTFEGRPARIVTTERKEMSQPSSNFSVLSRCASRSDSVKYILTPKNEGQELNCKIEVSCSKSEAMKVASAMAAKLALACAG
jgi:hypothetical protein